MPYRPMGRSGGGGGPLPEKTQGWLWGFLFGALSGMAAGWMLAAYAGG